MAHKRCLTEWLQCRTSIAYDKNGELKGTPMEGVHGGSA